MCVCVCARACWVCVERERPTGISSYLSKLMPVLLREDCHDLIHYFSLVSRDRDEFSFRTLAASPTRLDARHQHKHRLVHG